jgi:hypothetical protein
MELGTAQKFTRHFLGKPASSLGSQAAYQRLPIAEGHDPLACRSVI